MKFFSQGKTYFHYREPCSHCRDPCNEKKISLWEKLHRENPVFITGMGLQCNLDLLENCELVVLLCGIAARLTDLYFYKGEFILSIPIPLYVPGWPLWGHKYVCAGVKNKETVSFMSRNTKAHWKWRPFFRCRILVKKVCSPKIWSCERLCQIFHQKKIQKVLRKIEEIAEVFTFSKFGQFCETHIFEFSAT